MTLTARPIALGLVALSLTSAASATLAELRSFAPSSLRCTMSIDIASDPVVPGQPSASDARWLRLHWDSASVLLLARATRDTVLAGPGLIMQGRTVLGRADTRAVYGQVSRMERVIGTGEDRIRQIIAASRSAEVVLVPWGYDPGCQPYFWANTARWTTPDSVGVYMAYLRPDSLWVDGRPTLDVRYASMRSYAYEPHVMGPLTMQPVPTPGRTSRMLSPEAVYERNAARVPNSPKPGTYRLFACATACAIADSSQARAMTTIVIADDSTASTPAWKSAMTEIVGGRRMYQSGSADNVCFNDGTVGSPADKARAYLQRRAAGDTVEALWLNLDRNGTTHWVRADSGGSYTMTVLQSPDASTFLRWYGNADRIVGEVWDTPWRTGIPARRVAFFVALRVGPPSPDACR